MMRPSISRKTIIVVAVLASLVMYMAGVISGLYANKIIEKKVDKDIVFIRSYIDSSALDLKNLLLLQFFTDNLDNSCKFSELYLNNLHDQLAPYWDKLPTRLEEYEEGRYVFPDEYISLKREYIRLSLRIWLVAQKNMKNCDSAGFLPVLFFYSHTCDECVKQGRVFDEFRKAINKTLILFPIDIGFEDDAVYLLREYYNITSVPAVVIKDNIFQDGLISLSKLIKAS